MPQQHIDKDRSYKMHGGKFLDDFNEGLAEDFENRDYLPTLHPTKGFRRLSQRRLAAGTKLESAFHFWPRIAAKLTGSSVGGAPCERPARPKLMPHQGARECARRRGDLRRARLGIS